MLTGYLGLGVLRKAFRNPKYLRLGALSNILKTQNIFLTWMHILIYFSFGLGICRKRYYDGAFILPGSAFKRYYDGVYFCPGLASFHSNVYSNVCLSILPREWSCWLMSLSMSLS